MSIVADSYVYEIIKNKTVDLIICLLALLIEPKRALLSSISRMEKKWIDKSSTFKQYSIYINIYYYI